MARLRYDGCSTTLNGSLGDGSTSMEFNTPLVHSGGTAVPSIGDGDYLPMAFIDADGNLTEIVWITSYTSGGTTAEISRGQEGTSGTAQDDATAVVNAPTVQDFIPGTPSYLQRTEQLNPTLWYKFDNDATDSGSAHHDGTNGGDWSYFPTAGAYQDPDGYSIYVAGNGDPGYVTVTDPFSELTNGGADFTFIASFRATPDSAQVLAAIGDATDPTNGAFYLVLLDNGLEMGLSDGSTYTTLDWTGLVAAGSKTYEVVVTNNESGSYMYVNGVQVGFAVGVEVGGAYDLTIGGNAASDDLFFTGTIDNVMMFDHALTADEVAQHYDALKPPRNRLQDLDDYDASDLSDGLVIHAGGLFQIGNVSLGSLQDVRMDDIADNYMLYWDNDDALWKVQPIPSGDGSSTLAGLSDVDLSGGTSNGEFLRLDSGAGLWYGHHAMVYENDWDDETDYPYQSVVIHSDCLWIAATDVGEASEPADGNSDWRLIGLLTSGGDPDLSAYAPLDSPALTGNPTAPTASSGDNDTSVATTAFVHDALAKQAEYLTIALSDELTPITAGAGVVTMRAPFALTLTGVRASLTTASSSGNPAVDINKNGTSVLSTGLTIDATEKTSKTAATAAVIGTTSISDDDELTFDIDTAGTGAAGLKVTLYFTRA